MKVAWAKKVIVGLLFVCHVMSGFWVFVADAQTRNTLVRRGIDEFYEAKFDRAISTLQEAIRTEMLDQNDLFDAYLYLGFAITRKGAPAEAAEIAFRGSVRTDPARTLDSFKIPPDLLTRYSEVRAELVGGLYVVSNPRDAGVFGIQLETDHKLVGRTPVRFENLLVGEYNLIISKEKCEDKIVVGEVTPAKTDTIYVTLDRKSTPLHRKWWVWAGGGLVVAAAVAILVSQREEAQKPSETELPSPPDRPQQ